jgi:HSP20 family molecular chaperone IbpA
MAVMRAVGDGHLLPPHASIREESAEYTILLDVSDFTERELTVEALGQRLTVRGDQVERAEDEGTPFRLHERLEESFRLPDDADADLVRVFYKHGTIELRVPRRQLVPRLLPVEHPRFRVDADAEAV